MADEKVVVSFAEVARVMADNLWGRNVTSVEDFIKGADMPTVASCALVELVRTVGVVRKALADDELQRRAVKFQTSKTKFLDEFLAELGATAKECPSLCTWVRKECNSNCIYDILNDREIDARAYGLPDKGTAARKEYDAAKKRLRRKKK